MIAKAMKELLEMMVHPTTASLMELTGLASSTIRAHKDYARLLISDAMK
jgi:hypothetical protein